MALYRIILADNHALVRLGLKRILWERPDIDVVAEARDGLELMNMLRFTELAPNMVILDPSMPDLRGIDAIRKVKTTHPGVKLLVLSMHGDKEYLSQAIAGGAEGYLLKETADKELLTAIEVIRMGGVYIPPFP